MKKTTQGFLVLALVCVLTLFAGAVAASDPTDEEISKASLSPSDIPQAERAKRNPFSGDPASVERGRELFSSQCVMCHGADARGTGDLVERLKLEIPDLTSSTWQAEWSEGAFFYVIHTGHGDMPGQAKRFKDDMKWDLVSYVKSLAK